MPSDSTDAPVQPPPVGSDQSVLVLPTSSQVPGFVVDRAADRLRAHIELDPREATATFH